MRLVAVNGVLPCPAGAAEVFETVEVAAEVRSDDPVAHGAKRVLQVWIDLDLKRVIAMVM